MSHHARIVRLELERRASPTLPLQEPIDLDALSDADLVRAYQQRLSQPCERVDVGSAEYRRIQRLSDAELVAEYEAALAK